MVALFKLLFLASIGVLVLKWRSIPSIGKSIRSMRNEFKEGLRNPQIKDVTPKEQ